jgi:peptidoglycan hydrolase CwlO-like protein
MSEGLIVGIISAVVSLIGIFVSAKITQDEVTHKIDTNQQVMNNDITHIKNKMGEMDDSIKSHNNYAKLFNENIPVIKEKLTVANKRISDLEDDVRFYHRRPED